MMVSYWSLSDSKSPQVSRTLLNILADINNAVVWMVSSRPLICKSSSSCTNLRWLYQEHQLQLVSSSLLCSTVFSNSLQGLGTFFLFVFFQFYSVVSPDSKVHNSENPRFMLFFFLFCFCFFCFVLFCFVD